MIKLFARVTHVLSKSSSVDIAAKRDEQRAQSAIHHAHWLIVTQRPYR
jgi:hypothetical protein